MENNIQMNGFIVKIQNYNLTISNQKYFMTHLSWKLNI